MDSLDTTSRDLYIAYIAARNAWITPTEKKNETFLILINI